MMTTPHFTLGLACLVDVESSIRVPFKWVKPRYNVTPPALTCTNLENSRWYFSGDLTNILNLSMCQLKILFDMMHVPLDIVREGK